MTDQQALHKYASSQDAEAFRILVEHYQGLVYSAASRRLARVEDIEDVVQLTFLKLAKSANAVRRNLSAWLYTTAINTANDMVRRDETRRRHEAIAAADELSMADTERGEWDRLSTVVDDVLLELPNPQQLMLVEHFLRGRSQRELAAELNVSQPTVLRRIDAAVEELRDRLTARGYPAATPMLASALAKFDGSSVPATTTAELAKIGLAGVSAATGGASATGLVAICLAGVALVALVGGLILLQGQPLPPGGGAGVPAARAGIPATIRADWRAAFDRAYALEANQNLKFVPPPPLPERQRYFHEVEGNDTPMPFIQWRWIGNALRREQMVAAGPDGAGLAFVLGACAKLDVHQAAVHGIAINADGDWIVRDGAPVEAILVDLQKILSEQFKTDVRFEKTEVKKEVLVITGQYRFQRLAEATSRELQIFSDVMDHPKPGDSIMGGGTTSAADFWTMLGGYLGSPFIDESENEPAKINWLLSRSLERGNTDAGRQQVLDNISKQTGLTFNRENRVLTTWSVKPAAP